MKKTENTIRKRAFDACDEIKEIKAADEKMVEFLKKLSSDDRKRLEMILEEGVRLEAEREVKIYEKGFWDGIIYAENMGEE